MSKIFSPSLTMREEPANSLATVMFIAGKSAIVNFRGKTYVAVALDSGISVGSAVRFIEHPRFCYFIKKSGISWYGNPLANWIKGGHRAGAALEYLLRKNRKFCPFFTGDDEELHQKEMEKTEDGFWDRVGVGGTTRGIRVQSDVDDIVLPDLPDGILCMENQIYIRSAGGNIPTGHSAGTIETLPMAINSDEVYPGDPVGPMRCEHIAPLRR